MEVIGGSIRVPVFQKVLKEGLKRDILDMHLNGDETVALGSAFRAANVSTAFKPRFVGMSDITPFSVGVELYRTQAADQLEEVPVEEGPIAEEAEDSEELASDLEKEKQTHDFLLKSQRTARSMELFPRHCHYKTQKKLTVQAYEDFQVYLYYDKPEELPASAVVPIATFNISGIAQGLANVGDKRIGQPNVTLVFSNDMNGMVVLKDAYMKVRFQYQEEVPVEQPKEEKSVLRTDKDAKDAKEDAKEEKKEEEQVKAPGGTEPKGEEGEVPAVETPAAGATEDKTEEKAEDKPEKKTMLVTKRKIRKVSLRVQALADRQIILPMTKEEKEKSIAL